jgi:hypothetical protein
VCLVSFAMANGTNITMTSSSDFYTICAYYSGSCVGLTVCKSYVTNECFSVYDHCTGVLLAYGIFSQAPGEYSAVLYDNAQCTDDGSTKSFTTTCNTCILLMNAEAQ